MSKKDKDYTGFPGDCNQTQLKALSDFRKIVTQMGLNEKIYDDPYLLRFLRARKFDLGKTQQMFNDFIKWRKENDVDNIMTYMFDELPLVRTHYPHGYHKTDKMGRPIYIERIGMLQLNKLFEVTSEQRLIKYYIQSYELLLRRIFPACSQAKGTKIEQSFTILDLKGGSMKMVSKQPQISVKITTLKYLEECILQIDFYFFKYSLLNEILKQFQVSFLTILIYGKDQRMSQISNQKTSQDYDGFQIKVI